MTAITAPIPTKPGAQPVDLETFFPLVEETETVARGILTLNSNQIIRRQEKERDPIFYPFWEDAASELFVPVTVFSEQSKNECSKKHHCKYPQDYACELRGTWHDYFSQLPDRFPRFIPLKLLINPDDWCKNNGAEVRINFKGQKVLLICQSTDQSFAEGLVERIKYSFVNCFFSKKDLDQSIASARKIKKGAWIHSH